VLICGDDAAISDFDISERFNTTNPTLKQYQEDIALSPQFISREKTKWTKIAEASKSEDFTHKKAKKWLQKIRKAEGKELDNAIEVEAKLLSPTAAITSPQRGTWTATNAFESRTFASEQEAQEWLKLTGKSGSVVQEQRLRSGRIINKAAPSKEVSGESAASEIKYAKRPDGTLKTSTPRKNGGITQGRS